MPLIEDHLPLLQHTSSDQKVPVLQYLDEILQYPTIGQADNQSGKAIETTRSKNWKS